MGFEHTERTREMQRAFTRALADDGLYFTLLSSDEGPRWTIGFDGGPDEPPVVLIAMFNAGILRIGWTDQTARADAKAMNQLLLLNGSMIVARACVDSEGYVLVMADLPWVSKRDVDIALQTVLLAAPEVRKILDGKPFSPQLVPVFGDDEPATRA